MNKVQHPSLYVCQSGTALVLVAAIAGLLLMSMAVVTDLGRIYVAQSKAQAASDAALLGAAATANTVAIQREMERLFRANYPAEYLGSQTTPINIALITEGYESTFTLVVPTIFGNLLGIDTVRIPILSQVTRDPARQLEIALALDNTGSMAGEKIQSLRNASNLLVDILFGPGVNTLPNLHISVVPYDIVVNIGPNRRDWIQDSDQRNGNPFTSQYKYDVFVSGANTPGHVPKGFAFNRFTDVLCGPYVVGRQDPRCDPDTVQHVCSQETGQCTDILIHGQCYDAVDLYDDICPNNGFEDVSDEPPTSPSGKFRLPLEARWNDNPGDFAGSPAIDDHIYINNLAPIVFASNVKADVHSALNAMQPSGDTRIPIGLMWGWFTLSPRWQSVWDNARPDFPRTPNPLLDKILVLMTDGKNAIYNRPAFTAEDDAKTSLLCSAIKAQNIKLYVIGFGEGTNINEPLLQSCATSPTYYFHAPTSDELQSVFQAIADDIVGSTLRLSK